VEQPSSRPLAAAAALDLAGVVGDDTVVRDGSSLLMRRGDVLARVRPAADRHIAERELTIARRLEADGVPVTPLVDHTADLVDIHDQVVSLWRWCPPVRDPRSADLGLLAGRLRRDTAPSGPAGLDPFDPIGHVLDAVAACGPDDDVRWVRERANALIEPFRVASADDPLGASVVHGDLHLGNVVVAAEGPLLTDLELAGWGASSFDTSAAVVAVDRYGAPAGGLERYLAASGADPRPWPGFATFVAVTELWVTAWAVSVAHRHPDWAAEARTRVATLRDGLNATWRLY
jgi:hypothetical protein